MSTDKCRYSRTTSFINERMYGRTPSTVKKSVQQSSQAPGNIGANRAGEPANRIRPNPLGFGRVPAM